MRVEPYEVGSILHVVKRGTRGLAIVRETEDCLRFVRMLFLLNDTYTDRNWLKNTRTLGPLQRPAHWPEREPLVRVLAWTLMPNHFHLLLEETRERGIATFMQRICGSMAKQFNVKYATTGGLFQSAYKGKVIDTDDYLRIAALYIQVKNVIELYPGGLEAAMEDFESAWEFALRYPYSSLPVYALGLDSPIIGERNLLQRLFADPVEFKAEAKEALAIHMKRKSSEQERLLFEDL